MSDPNDVSSAMEAAQHAAGGGDFATAERELRRAFALQEAALGPTHPDLANTLNNLGVVSERLNKPADAERYYRRAYTIASSVLQPDHPFVAMSAKNLRDFCEARGIPFERPAAPTASGSDAQPRAAWPPARKVEPPPAPAGPIVEATPAGTPAAATKAPPAVKPAPAVKPVAAEPEPPASPAPPAVKAPPTQAPATTRRAEHPKREPVTEPATASQSTVSPRTLAIGALVIIAVILAGLWSMRSSRSSGEVSTTASPSSPAPAAPASSSPSAAAQPTAQSVPEQVTPPPEPAPAREAPATPPQTAAAPAPPPVSETPPAAPPSRKQSSSSGHPAAATLVSAQLCRPLTPSGSWRCTPPASSEVAPGVMFFYTRVTCPADTTIEHRWYHNDRLLQNVTLRIQANSGPGYRTYSRTTITPERAGDWRVELRSADGTVLDEERFSVAR